MQKRISKFIGITGVFILLIFILLKFTIVPSIVKSEVKKKLSLKNGWPMREIWSKLPFVIENHVYIFNVTNPVEIGNGAKPIVREIGPFVYDMFQEKVKQSDNEKDDTVSFVLENTYFYNRMKSHGLSDDVEVYMPHLFILTVATGPLRDNPSQVSFTSRAVDTILNKPESLFYKVKVKDILFDGLPLPCGSDEYFGKLICNEIHQKYSDFLKKDGDTYYASLFGFRNGSTPSEKRIRIRRGSKKLQDLGKLVEIDGMKNLSIWKDDKCNEFAGSDGTIFPPLMSRKKKLDIPLVYPAICRRLTLNYDSSVHYAGLNLMRYIGDLGTDGNHVPEEKCYCHTPETCLRRGMFDVYRCLNVPIIISNPHFYLADPYYLTTVDTLHPNKEKHLTYVDFDPLTGSPVRAHVRAQYNMELMAIDKFRLMRNYSYSMLPIIWTDEIVVLPDFFILKIKIGYLLLKLAQVGEYLLLSFGLSLCLAAGFLEYKWQRTIGAESNKSENNTQMSGNQTITATSSAAANQTRNNNNNNNNNTMNNMQSANNHRNQRKFSISRRLLSAIRPAP